MHFGMMRVFNDDTVGPGKGFGTHPHENMEIISIPLSGGLQHEDSSGNGGIINSGDVQVMSAGRGIMHSEFNASKSESVNFFQIWIFPEISGVEPRCMQKSFDLSEMEGKWRLLVSPDGQSESLWIHQNAFISRYRNSKDAAVSYSLHQPGNGLFLMVIEGGAEMYGEKLDRRDAIGISDLKEDMTIQTHSGSDLLLVEVPMN